MHNSGVGRIHKIANTIPNLLKSLETNLKSVWEIFVAPAAQRQVFRTFKKTKIVEEFLSFSLWNRKKI